MVRVIRKFPNVLGTSPWAPVLALAFSLALSHRATGQTDIATADYPRQAGGTSESSGPPVRLSAMTTHATAHSTQVCRGCNQLGAACSCGGAYNDGGCAVRGTNLFWCSPYPQLVADPCGAAPCLACDFNPTPLLYASIEIVPLYRDQKDDPLFQSLGPGGRPVLETGDFETEFDAGMRVVVGATLTDRYRVEAAYQGSYEWSDRVAIRNQQPNALGGSGNLYSPFSNFGIPTGLVGADYNRYAQIEMTSNFNSAEFNVRRRCCSRPKTWPYRDYHACIANSFLVGLRYLSLDEQFGYVTESAIPAGGSVNRAAVDASNSMFGVQIGMLSQFTTYWESGWVDFELKGGIYHNEAEMRSDYELTDGTGAVATRYIDSDAQDRTSFLGEVSLHYNHQITTNLSMRLGYTAAWLSGVALGSENISTNLNLLSMGPAQLEHGGDVIYHGPSIGFTFAY